MVQRFRPHLVALVVGMSFWLVFARATGVAEPWDATGAFWAVAYPLSLALSGVIAYRLGGGGWVGLWIIFAQLPVMAFGSEVGPLILAGVVFLIVLSVPAVAIAAIAGRIRRRARPAAGS